MPTITRWFPVSHDINGDPEMWELRDLHGHQAGFIWLEILSIADRNKGLVGHDPEQLRNQLASKCRTSRIKAGLVLDWCRVKGWLTSDDGLRVAKFAEYHKTRGTKVAPSYPSEPSEPNLTIIKNHKNDSFREIEKKQSISRTPAPFPDDWKWLLDFVNSHVDIVPKESFLDFRWWDSASYGCGGLDEQFLTVEYNKMARWLMENPRRRPTPRGWRRFVAGWLERANDKERRFANGTKSR